MLFCENLHKLIFEIHLRRIALLFIGFFFLIRSGMAQELTLPLAERSEDAQYKKLILVTNVFLLETDSVSNPLDISSALASDPVFWHKVVLPEMSDKYRKGFAWIYDGSSKLEFAPAYTLIVIENPGWTLYPTKIWVDRNHNFDLTDDGEPYVMTVNSGVIVSLGFGQGYQVYLEHFPDTKFAVFSSMNENAVRKLQGTRKFMGTGSSFREKRLNVLSATWVGITDSVSIGVKDVNCNGRYNDDDDVVMIANAHAVFDNLQGVKLDHGKAYLEWGNASYNILEIEPSGKYIRFFRDTASRLKFSLNKGDKIPRFKYCSATKPSKHKSIRRLRGKYIYVYIWRDGAEAFYRDSADWHRLGNKASDSFEVLGLNYGASALYVYKYNKLFETRIRQGYSSNDINRKLMIKSVPYGILINKKQRILATDVTPAEAEKLMHL